jgi:hypothetical protein
MNKNHLLTRLWSPSSCREDPLGLPSAAGKIARMENRPNGKSPEWKIARMGKSPEWKIE